MKNTLFKSTIILLIGGAITKILSMIIKIVLSRYLGDKGVGYYQMILPTFTLLIALASLGLPSAISKLVSEGKRNNKRLVFSLIPVTLTFDLIVIITLIFLSEFIATNLLHNANFKYPIICMGLVLPFIDISSILRGYFFGMQKMIPHVVSNIIEDIVRLALLVIGIPIFLRNGIYRTLEYVILVNIVSELASILVLFIFIPKNFKLSINDFKLVPRDILDTFKIGVPATVSRLIGSIGYFLEPIILTFVLTKYYPNKFITLEYGIVNGYVMPVLLLPSFFTYAISGALLPIISKSYANKDTKTVIKKIKQACLYSLMIAIPFTIFIMLFPNLPLNILYHTNKGINYIRILAPIFIFLYIQAPLTVSLQAIDKSFDAMLGTLFAMIIRCVTLFLFSHLKIGIYPLIIATSINMIIVTIHHIFKLKKYLK